VPKYFIGEFLGAMSGAVLVFLAYYQHFQETEDPGLKLAVFSTGPAIRNYAWNLVTEIIGTFVLVFGILVIVANGRGVGAGAGTLLFPLLVALLVLGIGLSLGGPTGYAINPARDLGPRIMHAILPVPGKGTSDWSYAWVPVVGPLLGGALGGALYHWWYPF
jgi:glycerol uptake facilitator protein